MIHEAASETRKATQALEFFNVLTSPELFETTEAVLPKHRERLYPPTVALSMFMRQVLEADGSCQKAVNGWAAQRAADGLSPCSVRTGGYCRARHRAAATAQTAQVKAVWMPQTRAILGLVRLNFLSVRCTGADQQRRAAPPSR